MKYSQEVSADYYQKKELFDETDKVFIDNLKLVGLQGKEVVDLGCGDGRYARLIKEMGATHVIGLDISENMIELAKKNNIENTDVTFLVADGEHIPVANNSIDIVVSNFVVHYFIDTKKVFNEINRVLKNGGVFIGTFNITDVEEGFEYLYNQSMPIRLGQGKESIIVQNLIKSRQEIDQAIKESVLVIVKEEELNHPNATIDVTFSEKNHLQKHAVIMVLKKS